MPFSNRLAPLDRTLGVLEELSVAGVFSILLSGGEPTIHPDIIAIAEVSARNFRYAAINTNGIRHSKGKFAESFRRVAGNILVSISLDSIDMTVNDLWRGAAGRSALQAVKNCAAVGQPVCVSAVVTPESVVLAQRLVEELSPYCKTFKFSPIILREQSEAAALGPNYALLVTQCFDNLETRFANSDLTILLPRRKIKKEKLGTLSSGPSCVCSSTKLYINERLECYPCYYSANSDNYLGSIANNTFKEIWKSEIFDAVRARATQGSLCGTQAVPARYRPNA